MKFWEDKVDEFVIFANKHKVRMIMIGGGAVGFHGYQRHSADVDFWVEPTIDNFNKLLLVFKDMGYEIDEIPEKVKLQQQNITIKFTPDEDVVDIELVTNFNINKTFDQAYKESEFDEVKGIDYLRWQILSFNDLITSKIKANRPKDLLDIIQLQEVKKT